ncbi:DUF4304 domain-containing protein [Streptomyces sp. NPDC097619]|uniref:DUF4304 domain-containing protein n=1 Tax=Streptomyces sp. NPDC097619 TaxID=3157228 RepID=UPI0033192C9C
MGFDGMLKGRIAPRLRELGFKGSGAVYLLPDEELWVQLGFQKARGNTADEQRATVNLSVVPKAEWERVREWYPRFPARPKPGTEYVGSPRSPERIGQVMPGEQGDHWWSFRSDDPAGGERAAEELLAAIVEHGLPWLRAEADRVRAEPAAGWPAAATGGGPQGSGGGSGEGSGGRPGEGTGEGSVEGRGDGSGEGPR